MNTWGGARKKSGRKKLGAQREVLTITLDPKILAQLKAKVPGGYRSVFVEDLIYQALKK